MHLFLHLLKLRTLIAALCLLMPIMACCEPTDIPMTSGERLNQSVNELLAYYIQGGKRQGPEWLKTTDINLAFSQDYKPLFSLETIQPLNQLGPSGALWFWQGRFAYQSDDSTTGNVGIGWRKLVNGKQGFVGLNAFYDQAFKYNHVRVGLGTEYFNRFAQYRANVYLPLTGAQEVERTPQENGMLYTYERAVRGFDVEAGSTFRSAPWLGAFLSGFYYDNKYHDNTVGYKLRTNAQLPPYVITMGSVLSW
ncbi:MAG TPA: inverse autotransporter beta domain-containing protein [Armatimonadota bacterium]|nr:inverse autotransporter beta domain-containing protein [Armatimonadota bacterium]